MRKAIDLKVKHLKVFSGLEIVVKKVRNCIHCNTNHLHSYQHEVWRLINKFEKSNIIFVPQGQNQDVDLMANMASKLSLDEKLKTNKFLIELIFRPLILDNVTNWQVLWGSTNTTFSSL